MAALIGGSPRPLQLLQRLGDTIPYDERTIDLVLVTDPRTSTVSAYESVLRHYSITEVLDVGAQYPNGTYSRWRTLVRDRHLPAYAMRTGAIVSLGNSQVEVIAPDGPCSLPQNCAGMLRLTVGLETVLLAGSSSAKEQTEAIFRNVPLRAGILVCPTPACAPSFIRAVSPKVVFSAQRPDWRGQWRQLNAAARIVG
jgi:beta-lactamase superfamily II metal-dependent hydrolase